MVLVMLHQQVVLHHGLGIGLSVAADVKIHMVKITDMAPHLAALLHGNKTEPQLKVMVDMAAMLHQDMVQAILNSQAWALHLD